VKAFGVLARDIVAALRQHGRRLGLFSLALTFGLGVAGAGLTYLNKVWINASYPGGAAELDSSAVNLQTLTQTAGLPIVGVIATALVAYLICRRALAALMPNMLDRGGAQNFVLFALAALLVGLIGFVPTIIVWSEVRMAVGPFQGSWAVVAALVTLTFVLTRPIMLPFLVVARGEEPFLRFWTLSRGRFFWLWREFAIVMLLMVVPVIWGGGLIDKQLPQNATGAIVAFVLLELKAAYLLLLYPLFGCAALRHLQPATETTTPTNNK
jgi:hypothetical protein